MKKYRITAGVVAGFFMGEIVTEDDLGGPDGIPRLVALRGVVPHEEVETDDAPEVQSREVAPDASQTGVGQVQLPDVKRPQLTTPQDTKA